MLAHGTCIIFTIVVVDTFIQYDESSVSVQHPRSWAYVFLMFGIPQNMF